MAKPKKIKKQVSKGIKKIVWALDAFDLSRSMEEHTVAALKTLTQGNKVKIEPVYVLSPEQLDLTLDFSSPWLKEYKTAAGKALEQKLSHESIQPLKDSLSSGKVLVHHQPSLRGALKVLTTYAASAGADLIVVGSHGRKGLSRMMLGSFAETLVLHSKVPVLVIGPKSTSHSHTHGEKSHIVFPTDFTKKSQASFKRALQLAKFLNARVTLLHAITNPIEPVVQSGVYLLGGGWVPVPVFMEKQEETLKAQGAKWLALASASGVQADLFIDRTADGVVSAILSYLERNHVDMVAIAAESGPVASAVMGSVTRNVVRRASAPVWVLKN